MSDGDKDRALREHLLYVLRGGGAHIKFEDALEGFPAEFYNARADGVPYTPWQLLEHMRIAQWDILEFSRNPGHVSPAWPEGYWPETEAPPHEAAWDESVEAFRRDLQEMKDLVANPETDLYARIPWGDGQTILREAMLVADHNAYHVAQIVMVRQALGAWGSSPTG